MLIKIKYVIVIRDTVKLVYWIIIIQVVFDWNDSPIWSDYYKYWHLKLDLIESKVLEKEGIRNISILNEIYVIIRYS